MRALLDSQPSGFFPAEGHREASRVVIFRRPHDASRCPPGGDVQVPGVFPASPSPPHTHVIGWKVGHGRELRSPLDPEERESIDSNPGSVRWFRLPPPIRGPPEA